MNGEPRPVETNALSGATTLSGPPYAMRSRPVAVLLALLLIGLVGALVVGRKSTTHLTFSLALVDENPLETPSPGRIYFDRGMGYRLKDSVPIEYSPAERSGEFRPYEVNLPTRHAIRSLRFNPGPGPGNFLLREVALSKYLTGQIDLLREARHFNRGDLIFEGDALRLAAGPGASLVLSNRTRRHTSYVRFLPTLFLLGHAMLFAASPRIRNTHEPGGLSRSAGHLAWATVFVGGFIVFVAKTIVLLASTLRFGASVSPSDVLESYAADLFWVAALSLPLHLFLVLEHVANPHLRRGALSLATIVHILVIVAAVLFGLFQIVSAYVFYEWGAFLERDDIVLIWRSVATDSVWYYLMRPGGILAAGALIAAVFGVVWLGRVLGRPTRTKGLIAVTSLGLLLSAFAAPALVDSAAVQRAAGSPFISAFHSQSGVTWDIGARDRSGGSTFTLPAERNVPAKWEDLAGIAEGNDLVIVVLESVRRSNVSLYGYGRETTPELDRMAMNSLVFDRAYASQPRSAKTLASMMLGIYPDPRLEAISWNPDRVRGKPNLLSTLRLADYELYFGITFDQEIDSFGPFVEALWDAPPTREGPKIVELSDLVSTYGDRAKPGDSIGDDSVLVEDFLEWYEQRDGPSVALLWLAGGHHPYKAAHRPFANEEADDPLASYDNCIFSSDRAIGELERGIARSGKKALTLILGDHGEAFNEHPGDSLHGRYLYDGSVRVPFLVHARHLFDSRRDVDGRFTMKDVPATLFYLMGHDPKLRQSHNIFSRTPEDRIYLSTVYGDYKLGLVADEQKWVYWPRRGLSYVFETDRDPGELVNRVGEASREEVAAKENDLLSWYGSQIDYVERAFPSAPNEPP